MALSGPCFQRGLEALWRQDEEFRGDKHNIDRDGEECAGEVKEKDCGDQVNTEEEDKDDEAFRREENSQIHLKRETTEEEEDELQEVNKEWTAVGGQKSGIEDVDSIRIYSRDSYTRDMFQTLQQLRDSSLLTDLTLSTEAGQRLHAHSPVLAAVSSLVHQRLQERDEENERRDVDMYIQTEISISLGPEVGLVGLAGVLEFAYTGALAALNRHTLAQIQTAATTLGVPRVLQLCSEEEEKIKKGLETRAEEKKIPAEKQMKVSLQSIRQLWTKRVGCDVELEVGGASFHVHRVLLSASSDYFRGMFTSGMKESQQACVALPFLEASELEALIGYSYSGSLPLSWGCVFEITCIAFQLQFQPALLLCLDFLKQEMDAHSCLDVASFAEAYGITDLLEEANDFVLRHFQNVAATSKFQDLSVKKLRKYLKSNSLFVSSELVVFKAVVVWIEACPSERLKLTKELMKNVHFPLMTFKEFGEVKTTKLWTECNIKRLYQTMLEDFHSYHVASETLCRVYLPKDSLVLVGGDQISADFIRRTPSRELWFGNSLRNYTGVVKTVEWRLLGEMPNPPRLSHELAVVAGKLYVLGGQNYKGMLGVLNSVYRYDPLQNRWERLANLQEKRCNFSVVVLDEMIYAIGGYIDPETNLDSVERYCPNTDSWSFAKPLDMTLSCHAATLLDGEVFISGGFDCRYHCLVSMFLYHPERGTTYLAEMSQPRAHHCMETLNNHLYVVGGVTVDENMMSIDQLACEVYDPVSDSWSTLTPLAVSHVGAASVVLEGKIYVLGGYCQEDYRETRLVHRYDPTIQLWENIGEIPGPNTDIRACLLHLPKHLRQ
ncbi:kelch-like protein 33 [Oncorhynchus tshawytscha]|uniref:kelch-like protein 33 n=1 Tax=Oncorhynchus tshawytscha TaxID=74940 RepID=UPI000D0A52DE|nr:kelch-like protein 33 [Oncorhynchus tshawytscha]